MDTSVITDALSQAAQQIAAFVPKLLGAIVILLIGWFIARLIRSAVEKLLQLIRFDTMIDKSGIGAPLERAGYADSGIFVAKLVYFWVMLLVLQMAIGVFGNSAVSGALDDLMGVLPKILVGAIILVITGLVVNVVRDILDPIAANMTRGDLVVKAAASAIWIIGIFAALNQVEVAADVVNTLLQALVYGLAAILVIKFGVGGVWAARDRFWPGVYDSLMGEQAAAPAAKKAATK